MSNENTNWALIIGIAVVIICCCISSCLGYFAYSRSTSKTTKPKTKSTSSLFGLLSSNSNTNTSNTNNSNTTSENVPVGAAGKISGPCLGNGTCTDVGSTCMYNMCYQECNGRNAWPCVTSGDIPRAKTYWCDYSKCPAWVPPAPTTETSAPPSVFTQAVNALTQEQLVQAEAAAAAQAAAQQEAKLASQEAAQEANLQKQYCKCIAYPRDSLHRSPNPICNVGMFNGAGSQSQSTCFVAKGTLCTSATQGPADDPAAAWRICNPSVDY